MEHIAKDSNSWRWAGVDVLAYREEEGTHFRSITRQILFDGCDDLPFQMRYFEIDEGGYSTLEKHQHVHVVMVLRGRGQALVSGKVIELSQYGVVTIPSMTLHQFRATHAEPLGFMCAVRCDRDRPILPTADELEGLRAVDTVGDFIRV